MPNFDNDKAKRAKRDRANRLVPTAISIYRQIVQWSGDVSDAEDTNSAANPIWAAYTSDEQTELTDVQSLFDTLIAALEADHSDLLSQG